MQRVSEDFKTSRSDLRGEMWETALALKKRQHARWCTLQHAFQQDEQTRLRFLYYCQIATAWFPHRDVDVLHDAVEGTPRFSAREYSQDEKSMRWRGRIKGFETSEVAHQRCPFPKTPAGFEWGCGRVEQRKLEVLGICFLLCYSSI